MRPEAIASARWNPVNVMTSDATTTPADPSMSDSTSRNAPRRFKLSRWPRNSNVIETALPTIAATAKTNIPPEATSGGSSSRRTDSTRKYAPTPNSTTALTTAAKISTR